MAHTKRKTKRGAMPHTPRRLAYIRTSTDKQKTDRQILGLRDCCDEVFVEHGVSATAKSRPVYEALIKQLRPGDTLVVWDVDRAYRSVIDALTEVRNLNARGIAFEAMSGEYDLTSPEGNFSFTLRAALSEWERETIRKRTREGLAAAKARGVKLGRPRKLSAKTIIEAHSRLSYSDTTLDDLAIEYGVSTRTLQRNLNTPPMLDFDQDV